MRFRGSAFLALWNDFDPARDAEYDCWHNFEHVPERVGIDGFFGARRYVARERDDHRYFTLYDLASLEALAGASYSDVVDHPTEWSRSMRPSFRNFLRRPCTTVLRVGRGAAGSIATFRFGVSDEHDVATWRTALEPLLEADGVSGILLGRAGPEGGFPVRNVGDGAAGEGAPHVLVVEGIERRELDGACARIAEVVREASGANEEVGGESYDLAFAIERDDLAMPGACRQPPRPELQRRWK